METITLTATSVVNEDTPKPIIWSGFHFGQPEDSIFLDEERKHVDEIGYARWLLSLGSRNH